MNKRNLLKSFVALVASCLALTWGSPAEALQLLRGRLTTQQVECDTLCTTGTLTGGLAGTLDFEMASMTATDDPDVFIYNGVNVITTASGSLSGPDWGVWNIVTGEFVDYTTFTEGTGAYDDVHGSMVIWGTFDPVGGTGSSRYIATLF